MRDKGVSFYELTFIVIGGLCLLLVILDCIS